MNPLNKLLYVLVRLLETVLIRHEVQYLVVKCIKRDKEISVHSSPNCEFSNHPAVGNFFKGILES